eukprot:TRINITY_DN7785_c0_g1_i1.p1 TRINITY_DN7785_c0_g1~~TRINITY_DN7785_c0_g1_i1.p1  ORF type:complete len:339 (+),score=122.24 TRINITY_DN7785_c0_g1_i1:216-1232(+)
MVGGSGRSDGGSAAISSSNIFAALEGRRKTKKKDKAAKDASVPETKQEPVQFWTAPPVTVASWADCEDDDDDYFATVPPPLTAGVANPADAKLADDSHHDAEESEDDDDLGEEGDDNEDGENEHEEEEESNVASRASGGGQGAEPPLERGTERQLSKKELKKKELAELDAVLAELGLGGGEALPANSRAKPEANGTAALSVPDSEADGKGPELERGLPESKSAKAKKRKLKKEKEKSAGQGEEAADGAVPEGVGAKEAAKEEAGGGASTPAEEGAEGGGAPIDKERMKKLLAGKKGKSSGKSDTAVAQAAAEAKARAERLAAAKKKDSKNHYNQQPVR